MENSNWKNAVPDKDGLGVGIFVGNKLLDEIDIVDGVLDVGGLDLKTLKVPSNIHTLYCDNNHLTELKLDDNVLNLDCSNNDLSYLFVGENIKYLKSTNNPKLKVILTTSNNIDLVYTDPGVKIIKAE